MPAGTITAIKAQVRDSQRVSIFIDGAFAIGISLDTLAAEGLFVGQTVDEETWARLEASDQADQARHAALRLLEQRPRSRAELQQRLRRRDLSPAAIEQALDRLQQVGLLDDAAFSRQWVENRRSFRPRGRLALQAELRQKGVDRQLIAQALSDDDPEAELRRCEQVARAALGRYRSAPDRASFRRKLGGHLQRRGFTLDQIRPVLDRLWAEGHDHDHDDPADELAPDE